MSPGLLFFILVFTVLLILVCCARTLAHAYPFLTKALPLRALLVAARAVC